MQKDMDEDLKMVVDNWQDTTAAQIAGQMLPESSDNEETQK